jgi:hypothetical protein
MHSTLWKITTAFLFLLCSCASLVSQRTIDGLKKSPEVAFEIQAGEIYVAIRVNNGDEGFFLVDTGSQITVLDKSCEAQLGKRIGTCQWSLANQPREKTGIYQPPLLYLANTQLFKTRQVLAGDLSSKSLNHHPISGVLGLDVLRHYCVTFDFDERKLRFRDAGDSTNDLGKPFPLTIVHKNTRAQAEVSIFREKVRLLIDTGLHGDVEMLMKPGLFERALKEQQSPVGKGFQEHTKLRAAILPKLDFGGEVYTNVAIAEIPEQFQDFPGWIGSGFLARHRVTFDFPNEIMYLKRRTSRSLQTSGERFDRIQ